MVLLIQDLDRPDSGFITVNQQPMIDTAAGIAAYAD
jgi:ABC-type molybdate transport system ATPase subunit